MNISLPSELKDYVDARIQSAAYSSSSEYLRDLIRQDRDKEHLRSLIMAGMASPRTGAADTNFVNELRQKHGLPIVTSDASAQLAA
jgi:antitoxin ParD1/3/4